jgi:hypothetical protein
MEQFDDSKMKALGYNQLVCDIFPKWEDVKDEILVPERKNGTGNGTIHVFLGAADSELRKEFASYYYSVKQGQDPSAGAVEVKHFFLVSNVLSMLGYLCQYYYSRGLSTNEQVRSVLSLLSSYPSNNGLLETTSYFKLSTGASRLRPYFKQFDGNGVFTKLIRQLLLPNSAYKISLYKNTSGEYAAFWLIGFDWQTNFEANSNKSLLSDKKKNEDVLNPLQQIFYGAPGTGKSHTIKETTEQAEKEERVFRTTFHPDSDYSTFVGAYKPKMENNKIVYSYEPQAFTNAYIEAWKSKEDVYLIIEEINRGNCAQIFGDLFQLLDRKNGESEYPIKTDSALAEYLKVKFEGMDLPESIRNGVELKLPNNLYIWATMNTSDQSLFPIDSAFKRRWDWKYVKIAKGRDKKTKQPLSWIVDFNFEDGDKKYHCSFDWWEFILRINEIIASATSSDDKKLGYFFCKPKNEDGTEIDAETFVGKVVFYLWNDVLKEEKPELFKVHLTKGEPSFDAFYKEDEEGETVVDTLALKDFISNIFGDDFKEKVAINEITNKEIAENENLTLTPE